MKAHVEDETDTLERRGSSAVREDPVTEDVEFAADADARLMAEAGRGNIRAFEELVNKHARKLQAYFYHLCWDRAAAEDLSQEVFIKIWRARERYQLAARFTTYLYRVASNTWLDEVRRRGRRVAETLEESMPEGRTIATVRGSSPGPEQKVLSKERATMLKGAVSRLDDVLRMTFILSEYHKLPYQEIGRIMECPVGTVKSRKSAAMRKLRDMLKHKFFN